MAYRKVLAFFSFREKKMPLLKWILDIYQSLDFNSIQFCAIKIHLVSSGKLKHNMLNASSLNEFRRHTFVFESVCALKFWKKGICHYDFSQRVIGLLCLCVKYRKFIYQWFRMNKEKPNLLANLLFLGWRLTWATFYFSIMTSNRSTFFSFCNSFLHGNHNSDLLEFNSYWLLVITNHSVFLK